MLLLKLEYHKVHIGVYAQKQVDQEKQMEVLGESWRSLRSTPKHPVQNQNQNKRIIYINRL